MRSPAGEIEIRQEEERRRAMPRRRLRWERRRRRAAAWLALAGAAAILILGMGRARAEDPEIAELLERIRDLEVKLRTLEEDQDRLARALLSFEVPEAFSFAGESVPLDRWDVRERLEREVLLSVQDRGQVILWLKRASRYFPYIEEALRRADLPDDLKAVAVIESSLLPQARSRSNAGGIWQFIPRTARRYGLRVTPWWDERRDPELATRAALAYLADLYREFGRWSLALAAYNAGDDRVKSAIKRQRVGSYFQLALPKETERYVFRAYAAKLILSEPERFGFDVPDEQRYQSSQRNRIRLRVRRRLSVRAIADASGSFYREVRRLNPAILRDALPAGTYLINLPGGVSRDLPLLEAEPSPASGVIRYRVQRGDTLSAIARRYGVAVRELRRQNPTVHGRFIRPGDVLRFRPAQR